MVTWCPTRDVSPRCLATMAVALACMDAVLIMLLHDVFGSSSGSAIWAVYPAARHTDVKVRMLVDFLVERWATAPWRVLDPA